MRKSIHLRLERYLPTIEQKTECYYLRGGIGIDLAKGKILVTGGTGFIGSHICISLIQAGHKVVCLDNLTNGKIANLEAVLDSPNLTLIDGDIRSMEDCQRAMEGCTHVCHLAARSSVLGSTEEELMENNLLGTENLLKCALENDISMFVFSSSCAVYGDAEPPITVDSELRPISTYGQSKMLAEKAIEESRLDYRILRYFNVYGPRQRSDSPYSAVIPIFASKLLTSQPPTLYGNGEQTRDFIHVDDVVSANLSALEGEGESIRNIGTGVATSIAKLLTLLQSIMTQKIPELEFQEPAFASQRSGEILHSWCGDSTGTIPIEIGLQNTITELLASINKDEESR